MGCRSTRYSPLTREDAKALIDERTGEIKAEVHSKKPMIYYQHALFEGETERAARIANKEGWTLEQRRNAGREILISLLQDPAKSGIAAKVAVALHYTKRELGRLLSEEKITQELADHFEEELCPDPTAHYNEEHSEIEEEQDELLGQGEVPPDAEPPKLRKEQDTGPMYR